MSDESIFILWVRGHNQHIQFLADPETKKIHYHRILFVHIVKDREQYSSKIC